MAFKKFIWTPARDAALKAGLAEGATYGATYGALAESLGCSAHLVALRAARLMKEKVRAEEEARYRTAGELIHPLWTDADFWERVEAMEAR